MSQPGGDIRSDVPRAATAASGSRAPEQPTLWESPLDSVMERMGEGFFVIDAEWRVRYLNARAEGLLNQPAEELVGRTFWESFPQTIGTAFEREFRRAMRTGESCHFECYYQPLHTWFSVRAYPSKDSLSVFMLEVNDAKAEERFALALSEVNTLIHSTLDTDQILSRAVSYAGDAMQCESVGLALVDGDSWWPKYVHNMPEVDTSCRLLPEQLPAAERARESGRMIVINDTDDDAEMAAVMGEASRSARATLLVPLGVREESIGVLAFNYHSKPWRFSQQQRRFATQLASSVALALSNSQLYESAQRSAQLSGALSHINELLLSSLDSEDLMRSIVAEATGVVGADAALILVPEGREWVLRYQFGLPPGLIETRFNLSDLPIAGNVAASGRPMLVEDRTRDLPEESEIARGLGLLAYMVLPMRVEGETVGVLAFGYHNTHTFGDEDLAFAESLTGALSLALQNARIFEREHRIANTLQRALLAMPVSIEGVEFAHAYRSATAAAMVGGDFYDLYQLEEGVVGITIGDVSGKGLAAAALTSLVKNTIRAHAEEGLLPDEVVSRTSHRLVRETPTEIFVTLVVARFDRRDGTLTYCNAGHPGVLALSQTGYPHVRVLPANSPIAGAFENARFVRSSVTLSRGDTIVLYTDGVLETRDAFGVMYGEKSLVKLAESSRECDVTEIVEDMVCDVVQFGAGALKDDLGILAVRFTEPLGAEQPPLPFGE